MSQSLPRQKRSVQVRKDRAHYIMKRWSEGGTLAEIAQELKVSLRKISRDINGEHYHHLLCDEILQQLLETSSKLSIEDQWEARLKLFKLLLPRQNTVTTVKAGVNNRQNITKPKLKKEDYERYKKVTKEIIERSLQRDTELAIEQQLRSQTQTYTPGNS